MAWLILKILICISLQILLAQDLKKNIESSDSFFEKIRKKYENVELTDKIKAQIDQEVDHYVNVVSRELYVSDSNKDFENASFEIKGTKVFKSIHEVQNLNLPGMKDICFFKQYVENEQWFGAVLMPSYIAIYQVVVDKLIPIISHAVENGSKLRVVKYSGSVLLTIQKLEGIAVFTFGQQGNKYFIREVDNIDIPSVSDLFLLRTTTHLLLGASTPFGVRVYDWLDSRFALAQALPYAAERLALFQQDGTTYLVISSASKSVVLRRAELERRFLAVQTLRGGFLDVAVARTGAELLVAAGGPDRTVVYKLSADQGLAPLQEIGPADRLVAVTVDETMLLALLKDGTVDVYQYDGWRFVRLSFRLTGVSRLKVIVFKGAKLLLVKWFDDDWSLNRINWMKTKDPEIISRRLQKWLLDVTEKVKQNEKLALGVKHRLRLPAGLATKLKVNRVNEISVETLQKISERYDRLESRLAVANQTLNDLMPGGVLHLSNFRAKTVRLNCTKQCRAEKLITKLECDDFANLRKINDEERPLRFEHVVVRDQLDEFPCPIPAVKLEKVTVKGLVNGISIEELEKNVLQTSGDQVITGELAFEELHLDSLIDSNFDVASTKTRQKIRTSEIRARELNLTGGLFLPLNGEPATMSGKLNLSKAKFDGLVHLHGHVGGAAIKRILPSVSFDGNYQLSGNYTLSNVVVMDLLAAGDVVRRRGAGRSFKEIARKAVPLDANMPVRLNLLQNSTIWKDITVDNFPKLLSKRYRGPVRVSGKKIAMKNVTLPDFVYSSLPIPQINTNVCTMGAITSDVRLSTLTVIRATARSVEAGDIFGAKELYNTVTDSVTTLKECDLSRKSFAGVVHIGNLNLIDFENSPFYGFLKAKFKWYRPDLIEGPLELSNLKTVSLSAVQGIKIPFPTELDNLVVEGNLQVKKINDIDFDSFVKNTVKMTDTVFLQNITFSHLEVSEIETANTNIELLSQTEYGFYFGNKVIDGDLEIEDDLSIPKVLSFPPENESISYIVEGSVLFQNEPNVERINGKNLSRLFSKIWMRDHPTNLTGNFIFNNIILTQSFDAYELLNTPNFGSWKSLENRLLSKTKSQEIKVPVYFREITAQNVFTNKNSILHSSDPYLNDFLNSSLKTTANQEIHEKWHIDQLIITGNMTLFGKINNLNLSTDVLRRGGKKYITGTKVAKEMLVKNLKGLGFDKWARDALMFTNTKKLITITGKKTFDKFYAQQLNVSGNVNGKQMKDLLLKINDQTITGSKIIQGSIYAPSIEVKGPINNVDVTDLAKRQVKRHEPIQVIESDVVFNGNLYILGNMTIEGTFQGVNLTKSSEINETLSQLLKSATSVKSYAASIKSAIKHHAKYWNKFEKVDEVPISASAKEINKSSLKFRQLGECELNGSQVSCNGENRFVLKMFAQPKDIIINKMFSIEDTPIIVQVSSGQKSRITVHMYSPTSDSLDVAANVRTPGVLEASVRSLDGILWIAARLETHMLVARYKPWSELHKYQLPATRVFALELVPATRELVLVRDDGMWKLDGLAGPRWAFQADVAADWIETFARAGQFYVRLGRWERGRNSTTLLRARYVGV